MPGGPPFMLLLLASLLPRWFKGKPPLETLSFEELRAECMRGSERACTEFVRRYQTLVWRTVKSHLPYASPQDHDEVVSNTFIALLSNGAALLVRYRALPDVPPEAYIRRQAVLQAMNRYRELHRVKRTRELTLAPTEAETPVLEQFADPSPTAEHALVEDEALQSLLELLQAELSPALLLTFELLFLRELEPAEVARLQGCTLDVVYTRKKRIHTALTNALRQQEEKKDRGGPS